MVPNGWSLKTLKGLCKMQAGKFVKASEIANTRTLERYPCYGGNGLRGYTKSFTHQGIFSLIGRQGALCGNITLASNQFHATEHAVVAFPLVSVDTIWLYYTLIDINLNQYATGQAQPGLSVKNLENIPILAPPLPEQQKIAKILSTWDKAISTTEALIDNSKQQKKALMQQLITGKKRFAGFEGDWEEVKLGELTSKITKGTTPSTNKYSFQKSGINFIKVESVTKDGDFIKSKFAYIDDECHKSFKRSQLIENDILFSIAGALGRVAIVRKNILPANTNQALAIVRLKEKAIDYKFLFFYLNSSLVSSKVMALTAQAAQPNLSLKDVGNLPILIPPTSEQQRIATVLTNAEQEIKLFEQQLADLKQEKKALMQQLLTGKRRVKVNESAGML
jgi:type I restriction enzyme S subunit